MSIFYVFLIVVAVGVLLFLANKYLAVIMDATVLRILNIAVIVGLVLWLLSLTGVFDFLLAAKVPRIR